MLGVTETPASASVGLLQSLLHRCPDSARCSHSFVLLAVKTHEGPPCSNIINDIRGVAAVESSLIALVGWPLLLGGSFGFLRTAATFQYFEVSAFLDLFAHFLVTVFVGATFGVDAHVQTGLGICILS